MKKFLILIMQVLLVYSTAHCQKRGNTWCFGDSCMINFNSQPPNTGSSIIRSRGSACSISDTSGNLLFYCGDPNVSLWLSGYFLLGVIYNKNNQIMDNGDSLQGAGWYNEMVIVPDPGNSNRYYLFHHQLQAAIPGLYYSVIDMSYNGGLGKVISKNNMILGGTMTDCVSAIKQGNGRDWWVIERIAGGTGTPNNSFNLFSATPNGIDSIPVQNIGSINSTSGATFKFNPTGEKFAFVNWLGLIEIYDFDRCTGTISNPINIAHENMTNTPLITGVEWSSDSRFLYVSTQASISHIYQYDLLASNIPASRVNIFAFNLFSDAGGALKLGPDGKIYYAIAWNDSGYFNFPYPDTAYNIYNMNLGVINQPDSPGTSCNFIPFSFNLGGKRNYWGLPNNPDYDLGPLVGSVCDTLHLSVSELLENKTELNIFPNPSNGIINFSTDQKHSCELRIINSIGKIIMTKQFIDGRAIIPDLNAGIYFAQLMQCGNLLNAQKFVVTK